MSVIDGKRVEHLNDGAYISEDGDGCYVLTANHHDPDEATDRVYLDRHAVAALLEFLMAASSVEESTSRTSWSRRFSGSI